MTSPARERAFAVVDDRQGFYMVRLAAIEALRSKLAGAPLASALGASVILARECRRGGGSPESGEQSCELRIEDLQRLLKLSRNPTRRVCEHLREAGAVRWANARYEGSLRKPGRFTFVGPEHPFAWVDAAACATIMARSETMPLRTLAIYLTLVDQAGGQRGEFPDAPRRMVRLTYADLERLSGVSERSARDHIGKLEEQGLLARQPQPAHELKAATVWRLLDHTAVIRAHPEVQGPAKGDPRSGECDNTGPASRDPRTGEKPHGGGATGDPRTGEPGAKDTRDPTQGPASSGSRAHEKAKSRETDHHNTPSAAANTATTGEGGVEAERLCQVFLEEFAHLGRRPRQRFESDRAAWLSAAADVLDDFGWASCAAAIAYLPGDYVLVSSATTMPAFAKVAEKAIARAHAVARSGTRSALAGSDGLGWPAAWARLRHAASVHGTAGKQAAATELRAEDPRLAVFIEQVRWRTVCQAGPTGHAGWKQLWEALAADSPIDTEEAA